MSALSWCVLNNNYDIIAHPYLQQNRDQLVQLWLIRTELYSTGALRIGIKLRSVRTAVRFPACSLKHSLHALSRLSGNVDQLKHLEVGLLHVQMFVEAASFTPLRHNGHVCLGHISHKQNDIDMPGLPVTMTETTSAAWPGEADCMLTVFNRC